MKFLLDESADFPLAGLLSGLGHDVKSIVRDFERSVSDESVLAIANSEDRILLTNDRDFGELVHRRSLEHRGIVLFRLGDESLERKWTLLKSVLLLSIDHSASFIVVTDKAIRVRQSIQTSNEPSDS